MSKEFAIIDGNESTTHAAYATAEVCAIYPITPSSNMGELADQWSSEGRKNIWGTVPLVVEMQSEGGAAGSIHGALQTGALATTFTASQGLLLMIPNMYKIAGELTPTVFHVSARAIAAQGLSIFGDHQDVMAVRQTGFAMICSASVQECMDMALIAQAASLESRVPFLHFFDGFRTSHEVNKVVLLTEDEIRAMIDEDLVIAHRKRALSPDHPVVRGTAQNPDVYFQGRETVNPFYAATPGIVEKTMRKFERIVGRSYKLFEYYGAPDAERVIVLMGSGAETAHETVEYLTSRGEKIGYVRVRLFRPFSTGHFLSALPSTVRSIAVLDRTKEPGSAGEPLYQDVLTALVEGSTAGALPMGSMPRVIGGRYGLSSKEFTPAMVKAVFDELKKDKPKNHFTVGIHDDVSHTSLEYDRSFIIEPDDVVRAMFFGLGADGTVGANKNSIKIIGEETNFYAQGYFVYDSKKSGSQTVSHLRFGPRPIRSTYLIQSANFIGCHQFHFLEKVDVLKQAAPGCVFLLNSPFGPEEVWDRLPGRVQRQILEKKMKFYVIDAYRVARETGMGSRINTIMQTCFFAISGVLPREEAIEQIKKAIRKTYGKKGEDVVQKNFEAVDKTLANLFEVRVPDRVTNLASLPPTVSPKAPAFVREVEALMMEGRGDEIPVSKLPCDGTYPTGTTKWEKRNISLSVPVWEPDLCTQCGMCALVCPHSCIRAKMVPASALSGAPAGFKSAPLRGTGAAPDMRYLLHIYVEDCTGCTLCVSVCPAKSKENASLRAINMRDKLPILERERANEAFFESLRDGVPAKLDLTLAKDLQYLDPLFEFSGACTGCGETPYVKIISQMFGDRMIVANATGCSSIYGGNLPTTPWTTNADGRGPAWSNSLFEDNAEFGFGFRLTFDKHAEFARELLTELGGALGDTLVREILTAPQRTREELIAQRARVEELKRRLAEMDRPEARRLLAIADNLVRRSVWIMGGDGWAYDIGYGGLDHVLASNRDVNILVMDTEVYSNTGGQMSKATPRGAVAKFAAAGKKTGKKDLGLLAISYGHVYVARVALGANPRQTLRALLEAEAYDGPSLIIAYSHCIAHGIDMALGFKQQKLAVDSGYWPLYRYNPELAAKGQNPFQLDSKPPSVPFKDYAYNEVRYRMLAHSHPEEAARLLKLAQEDVNMRWKLHAELAARQPATAGA
ncbi:MAG: pyruvate:ferredoxin (flavodoxin) oxidoreductase [Kiritimatiellae bacterium]|nr:pyruvate:ferredoxin (flavodoxin) oxidoreductase [Kiritimatiellia bacterium]MDW8457873.1 pyruvate:ferredoxin (flavodoxin) oxidoreductase [Verrucomicrobiota bacterium]